MKIKESLAVNIVEIVEKNKAGFSKSIYLLESFPEEVPEIFIQKINLMDQSNLENNKFITASLLI